MKKLSLLLMFVFYFLAACPHLFAFSDPALDEFQTALVAQNYKQAANIGEDFIKANPQHNSLHEVEYGLGIIYLRQGKLNESREILKQVLSQPKEQYFQDKVTLALFDTFYAEEDFEQAKNIIEPLTRARHPSEWQSQIYLRQARVYLKQAKWDDAHLILAKIMNEYERSLDVEYARQLLQEKQYFTVQVGAFNQRKSAESMMEELKVKGEYAYIVESYDKNNSRLYRVRVGRFSFMDEAKTLQTRLYNMGYKSARIYP